MSLRLESNDRHKERRERLWPIASRPRTSFVGDQSEHVISWRIELAVREAIAAGVVPCAPFRTIARKVIDGTDVSIADILSPRRHASIVRLRQEIMFRLATETTMSYPQIGRVLGDRDHTTIMHGARVHAARNGLALSRFGR